MKRRSAEVRRNFEALEPRQLLAAVFWDGGGGDDQWDNPQNWSGDALPGPSDDVVISVPGSPTIHHGTGDTVVHSLFTFDAVELSGGSIATQTEWRVGALLSLDGGTVTGAGNLALNSAALWTSGTISGSGKLQVLPGGNLSIAGNVTLARDVINNGQLIWAFGSIDAEGTTILNLPLRTFEMRSSGSITAGAGTNVLSNFGKVSRTTGASTTSTVGIALNNRGEVEVKAGTLAFTGSVVQREAGGILRGGAWTVGVGSGSATLSLAGGPIDTVWSGNSGATAITLNGSGAQFPELEGVHHFISNHVFSNTLVLAGGRQFTFASDLDVSGLVILNPGITTAIPNSLAIEGLVVGAGKTVWSGGGRVAWAHVVIGAELAIAGPTEMTTVSGLGLLRITGAVTWRSGLWVGSATLIEASGSLNILASSNPVGGTFDPKFMFRRLVNYGTVTWDDSLGALQLGAEFVNRGMFRVQTTGFLSTQGGIGPLVLPSWISNYGTIEKEGSGDLTLRGAGGGVHLANYAGGVVHVKGGRLIASGGGLSAGTFETDAGTEMVFGGLANILSGATLQGAGRFRVANVGVWNNVNATGTGDMIVNAASVLAIIGSGTLTRSTITNFGVLGLGDGSSVTLDADVVNNGIFGIGIAQAHITGDLTLSSSGIFGARSDDPVTHGLLTVDGTATLAGTGNAEFRWAAPVGVTFDFISAGTRAGQFSATTSSGLPGGEQITVDYSATGAAVRVV